MKERARAWGLRKLYLASVDDQRGLTSRWVQLRQAMRPFIHFAPSLKPLLYFLTEAGGHHGTWRSFWKCYWHVFIIWCLGVMLRYQFNCRSNILCLWQNPSVWNFLAGSASVPTEVKIEASHVNSGFVFYYNVSKLLSLTGTYGSQAIFISVASASKLFYKPLLEQNETQHGLANPNRHLLAYVKKVITLEVMKTLSVKEILFFPCQNDLCL